MGGVELLQDLVHNGVGEIGNHRQLNFSGEDWVRGKERERRTGRGLVKVRANQYPTYQIQAYCCCFFLLQSSVNVLCCSFHKGSADGRARDGHMLRDR